MAQSVPTSRLILTNLPSNLTKQQLATHLSSQPIQTTDLSLITSKDGQSRRIGFVGFSSIEDATQARAYLNNSYCNSTNNSGSKVKAQFAKPINHNKLSTNQPPSLSAPPDSRLANDQPDERLSEFLAVMNHNKKLKPQQLTPSTTKLISPLASGQAELSPSADDSFVSDSDYLAARTATNQSSIQPPGPQQDQVESDRLFVRNLTYSTTKNDLETVFSRFGPVLSVSLPLDKQTNQHKGFGYIQFSQTNDAVQAKQQLDGTDLKGRLLHIIFAQSRKMSPSSNHDKPTTLKQDKLNNAKADQSGLNWATLYLNPDAVMESVANRLNMPKADLLSAEQSGSSAVKLALAETHIINETKQFFASAGVNLDSLQFNTKRHPSTLLVKNLPFPTSSDTLATLFAPFGDHPPRIVVPPSGTIAIVDLLDPQAAKLAYKSLAYKQLGKSLLYLEKAPLEIWNSPPHSPTSAPPPTTAPAQSTKITNQPSPLSAGGVSLFVKNLSFNTNQAGLSSIFSSLTGYKFARVQTKPDPHQPGAQLSMGFGFVGFDSKQSAQSAIEARQGSVLDGHAIELQFAQRGKEDDDQAQSGKRPSEGKGSKLIVKNLPFEATRNELRELFSAYGTLKSVRLPKKVDRQTRGFAFVEFATSREANQAFAQLQHSHLLGRHLVLQWAQSDSHDIDKLRAKSKLANNKSSHSKSKFVIQDQGSTSAMPDSD